MCIGMRRPVFKFVFELVIYFHIYVFVSPLTSSAVLEIGWVGRVFISMTLLPAMNASGAVGHGWSQMNSANLYGSGDGGVCVCVRTCVGMRA